MEFLARQARKLSNVIHGDNFDGELKEEMRFHMEQKERDLVASGVPAEEAHYAAIRQFGNATALHELSRDEAGFSLESILQDLKYGARLIRRYPAFAITVITLLALGIGANTAIFSIVNNVLFRPLPYKTPKTLVAPYNTYLQRGFDQIPTSPIDLKVMREQNHSFEQLVGVYTRALNLTGGGDPEKIETEVVSHDFFEMLGVPMLTGRGFVSREGEWGNHRVAVIKEGLWKSRFGGSSDILGRKLMLSGEPYTVVATITLYDCWDDLSRA